MKRRAVLAGSASALSATVAGCAGLGGDGSDTGVPCDVTLTDPGPSSDRVVDAWFRADAPPHDPSRPEGVDIENRDEWDADYLGREMAETPSLSFETLSVSREAAAKVLQLPTGVGSRGYAVERVTGDRRAAVVESADAEGTVVLVGDCCGSSSVEYRWVRVEETEAGVHLHGYLRRPYVVTDDLSPRHSAVAVDRPPETVESVCVSLTTRVDERVHFDTASGVVSLVDGVIRNATLESVPLDVELAADDQTRLDRRLSLDPGERLDVGPVAEGSETLSVRASVAGSDRGTTEEYDASAGLLGIRVDDERVRVGEASDLP